MAEPTAPVLPDDAPKDVKDFFDCKGDKLEWKKGKVDWLGLPLSPDISFEHGKAKDSIDITINFPVIRKFTVNASVNDAGELVVDTANIPDLSDFKLPNLKKSVDDAVANINGWFKKNGKKLKKASFRKEVVTLEKTATTMAYLPPVDYLTPGQRIDEEIRFGEDQKQTVPVSLVATTPIGPTGGEWDAAVSEATQPPEARSVMPLLLLFLIGAAILGLITGIFVFGGNGPGGVANASPTATPSASPTASPTASPAPSATATVAASPSGEPDVSLIDRLCARIIHNAIGDYVSQIQYELVLTTYGLGADRIEIELLDANDDEPAVLTLDAETGEYVGYSGLHSPGPKSIVSVKAYYGANVVLDMTQEFVDYLGGHEIIVRYPEEDSYGECASPTP